MSHMIPAKIKAICGPNHWSEKHRCLIVIFLKGKAELLPDDRFVAAQHLFTALSGKSKLYILDGASRFTFLDLLAETALQINASLGLPVGFYRVEYNERYEEGQVVFEYGEQEAGRLTAQKAFELATALSAKERKPIDLARVHEMLDEVKQVYEHTRLGPSTYSIYAEAERRGIPVMRLDDQSLLQLGQGWRQKKVEATITDLTNSIAVDMAGDKHRTKKILADAYLPVPAGLVLYDESGLENAIKTIGLPAVIKPLDGNQGRGTTTDIQSFHQALEAFHRAREISPTVIVEKFIRGADHRILMINNRMVAAALRRPASVTGDGTHTIAQLIEKVNEDPRRGEGHLNVLTRITVDADTLEMLSKKNYTVDSVPLKGEEVVLKSTANLSTGGTAEDVTDAVHPANVRLFERAARTIGLDICGIDVMAAGLSEPITENGGAIIEVNAAPGIRMHLQPTSGQSRNVAAPIVDMLFPQGDNGRIPIVAVTGTNGKTTTTRLIARMAQQHGYNTGFTTTDGIYLNQDLIHKGDCSGPQSARFILKDSSVEFAVLETARGGILRSGLGYNECDCAVITNISEDHLGLDGIHTLEQLAKVKSVVARSVREGGWVVLNADDDHVYAMKDQVKGQVALFSLHPESARIQQHCEAGGVAAICDEGYIMIRNGNSILPVEEIENVALTYGGKAIFNVANALGATLAAWLMKITLPAIRCSLRNFRNSTELTPGRLNVFDFGDFTVLMDYAHNPQGLKALGEFIHNIAACKRVGVIAGVGDRRNEDIMSLGEIAGRIFDDVIIRMDEDLRGRTELELWSLLRAGVQRSAPDKPVYYFANETESVEYAIQTALPGSLVVLLVENIRLVCEKINELKEMRKDNKSSSKMKIAS